MRRSREKWIKLLLRWLPSSLAGKILRSSIDLDLTLPSDIEFKVADSIDEVIQALKIVHDEYVKLGYITPQPGELWLVPHHHLPSTTILIAKQNTRVLGTMTIVRDGAHGLPIESAMSVSHLRSPGRRLAEATCLAIHPDFRRRKGGSLLIHLMRYMYQFCTHSFGVSHLLVTVSPKDVEFYEWLLLFEKIHDLSVVYMGAPATGLYLDLVKAPERYRKAFASPRVKRNLHHFFVEQTSEQFRFPQRIWREVDYPAIARLLPARTKLNPSEKHPRKTPRIAVAVKATALVMESKSTMEIEILDISPEGVKARLPSAIKLDEFLAVSVPLEPGRDVRLTLQPRWCAQEQGVYGFSIEESTESWNALTSTLLEHLAHPQPSSSAKKSA